jgi:D-arabinose 1-dehydrogenase
MSEIVLGAALHALAADYPRASYQLMTKCGRYGPVAANFDYSAAAVRRSVARSLARLRTDYLDAVYLHDVEFVADAVAPRAAGVHAGALGAEAAAYGLAEGMEGAVRGPGDTRILEAVGALRELQAQGKVRRVGISGACLRAHLFTHVSAAEMGVPAQACRSRRSSASRCSSCTRRRTRRSTSCSPTRT